MRAPHFITLARVDQDHFLAACRRGIVHLTWGNATVRVSHDQLRRLAALLDRTTDDQSRISIRDRELAVSSWPDGRTGVQIAFAAGARTRDRAGSVVLVLTPAELVLLQRALDDSVEQLDRVLASGIWSQDETESDPPAGPPGEAGRFPFSLN